jgi:hypothetical protein
MSRVAEQHPGQTQKGDSPIDISVEVTTGHPSFRLQHICRMSLFLTATSTLFWAATSNCRALSKVGSSRGFFRRE